MGMQKWAIEQSHRALQRQAGIIAMLKSESRRVHHAGTPHPRLLIERGGRLQQA